MATGSTKLILGVTGLTHAFHDNSVALVKNGKVVFAASEERYSRIKHDRNFPTLSLKHALDFADINQSNIDYIAVGYPARFFLQPFLGKDFSDFLKVLFSWLKGRGFLFFIDLVKILFGEFGQNSFLWKKERFPKNKIIFVDHHLAHAASAYLLSGMDRSLAVVIDAFGPKTTGELIAGAVYLCEAGKIVKKLEEIKVSASIGLFYTSVTQALEFTPGDGEGKTMGLAAYGKPTPAYKALRKIAPLFLNGEWQKTPYWVEMFFANRKEFRPIFNALPVGRYIAALVKRYGKENVAASAQKILEEEVVKYFTYLMHIYAIGDLSLAGGLFLNVKMNKRISEIAGVKNMFIHPNAGDGGTAVGAALYVYSKEFGYKKPPEAIKNVSWGSGYSDREILATLKKYDKKIKYQVEKDIALRAAKLILEGRVVGWFQGRFEWGPRALGYRSVLVDPRRMDIKDKLNNTLKNREWFMPFAPSVMEEHASSYFLNYKESPFMTMAFDVKKSRVKDIKAAIHIDNTARPNTVDKNENPLYYQVIKEFYNLSGIPVVLNTSFNKHGLPIVNSPQDAVEHLLGNCIDELAIGNYLVIRKDFQKEINNP